MKKVTLIALFCSFLMAINANDSTMKKDTIFRFGDKVVSIKNIDDSLRVQVLDPTAETDSLLKIQPDPKSSVLYDGSNYNFVFSWKKRKKMSSHWTGFGMSFLNYNDNKVPNGALKMSTSHNFSLNLFEYYAPIRNSNWLFITGIGFDWFRYHFDSNSALTKKDGVTVFEPAPEGVKYKDSKLLAYYVTFPLLLEYQLPATKLHVSAGVVGFLKYYSKSQVKYYSENKKHVENMGRDLNIRPVDMKFRFQLGFGDISAYAYYSPFSMFDKKDGPDLKTYSIGLKLGF